MSVNVNTPTRGKPSKAVSQDAFAQEVELIRAFVWPDCTDLEIRFGLSVCQSLGLNPLLKHVVFIKSGNGPRNIYTTRDGLLHMAHQSGQLNGMQSGVIYAKNKDGEILKEHNRKVIEGAWCKVFRKDMEYPFEVEVNFEEYNRPNSQVWRQYPAAMIKKVAEHMAIKLAFDVSGLSSVEEMGLEEKQLFEAQGPGAREKQKQQKDGERIAQEAMRILIETIRQLQQRYNLSKEQIQKITGRETLKGLTVKDLEDAVLTLNTYCVNNLEEPKRDEPKAPERIRPESLPIVPPTPQPEVSFSPSDEDEDEEDAEDIPPVQARENVREAEREPQPV